MMATFQIQHVCHGKGMSKSWVKAHHPAQFSKRKFRRGQLAVWIKKVVTLQKRPHHHQRKFKITRKAHQARNKWIRALVGRHHRHEEQLDGSKLVTKDWNLAGKTSSLLFPEIACHDHFMVKQIGPSLIQMRQPAFRSKQRKHASTLSRQKENGKAPDESMSQKISMATSTKPGQK